MDRLPTELLQRILDFVMLCDSPFCLDDFSNAAKKRGNRSVKFWMLDAHLDGAQRSHLKDWRFVLGTCKRMRQLGLKVFFSRKTFAMTTATVEELQKRQVVGLSVIHQEEAISHIHSVVLALSSVGLASSFLKLPRLIPTFPNIARLNILLGMHHGKPFEKVVQTSQDFFKAQSSLTDALASIGTPLHSVDVAVSVSLDPKLNYDDVDWSYHETSLRDNVYPFLEAKARALARSAPK